MSQKMEIRNLLASSTDLVVTRDTGAEPRFTGHAIMTNSRTAIGNPMSWGFFEEVTPTAVTDAIGGVDARFLINHDPSLLVARTTSGDLRLNQDELGCAVDSDLDQELTYVRDFTRNLEKRRVTGMSFGFQVTSDAWSTIQIESKDDKGNVLTAPAELRTITGFKLYEVSGVTFPAYEDTDAALRALAYSPEAVDRRCERLMESNIDRRFKGRGVDLMRELRAGKTISAANMNVLQGILDSLDELDKSLDSAEDVVDKAVTDLAGVMGVDPPSDPADDMMDAASSKLILSTRFSDRSMQAMAMRFGQPFEPFKPV